MLQCTLHIWLLGATGFKESRYPPAVHPPYHVPCTRDTMQAATIRYCPIRTLRDSRYCLTLSSRDPRRTRLAASGGVHTATLQLPCRIRKTGHVHLTCHIIFHSSRAHSGNSAPLQRCSAAAPASGSLHTPPRRRDVINKVDVSSDLVGPQGPYTRRHEDATTSDPVEVSSDLVEVSSDSVEVR